ncbi:alpha/beta-hydrolase [Fistulina hepatica ATCC 64428]|uniref:Alpha/beta-hydrolase n=1 Tax=Fistulina hepatica ATCC 64428 TaxID=1128425 RepID=A0A0D7A3Y7_9AGAR|nr:alpha/beta-hydrolase [Fistulina hepatica ATCC 64428]
MRLVQWITPSSVQSYRFFCYFFRFSNRISELEDDARILWLMRDHPAGRSKVILYMHGGGFQNALQFYHLRYLRYVQSELAVRGVVVDVAILDYSEFPTVSPIFPINLRQVKSSIAHLLDAGFAPSEICVAGDSAGGNLAMQLVSHALHPVDAVPALTLSSPLAGVLCISPWCTLTENAPSYSANRARDILPSGGVLSWGVAFLSNIPERNHVYMEAAKAPETWFHGVERVASKFLFTAGDHEVMRDDIVELSTKVKACHTDCELLLELGGVHCNPQLDFMLPTTRKRLVKSNSKIIDWLSDVFA